MDWPCSLLAGVVVAVATLVAAGAAVADADIEGVGPSFVAVVVVFGFSTFGIAIA